MAWHRKVCKVARKVIDDTDDGSGFDVLERQGAGGAVRGFVSVRLKGENRG